LLIGLASEKDSLDYRLENDPRFRRRIGHARKSLREGRGVRIEDVEPELGSRPAGNLLRAHSRQSSLRTHCFDYSPGPPRGDNARNPQTGIGKQRP